MAADPNVSVQAYSTPLSPGEVTLLIDNDQVVPLSVDAARALLRQLGIAISAGREWEKARRA